MTTTTDDRPTDRVNIEQSALEDGMAEFCKNKLDNDRAAAVIRPLCVSTTGAHGPKNVSILLFDVNTRLATGTKY